MKRVFYNTGLVLVLMAVLAIPLMGFGFVSYQEEKPAVLGINISKDKKIEVEEQFEFEVVLAKGETSQTLYDVIPVAYLNDENEFVAFIPQEFKEKGITVSLVKNKDSLDLVFTSENEIVKSISIPSTILILN